MTQMTTRSGRRLFDELWRDFSPGFFIRPLHGDGLPQQIRLDLSETPQAFTLKADIPGVPKDDIHVNVEGNTVSLEAEIRQEDTQHGDGDRLLRSERYYGSVARTVQLPQEVDAAGAKAHYENGVLELTLPKKGQAAGSRVAID